MECSRPVTKTDAPQAVAVARERRIAILARQPVRDEADAVPGVYGGAGDPQLAAPVPPKHSAVRHGWRDGSARDSLHLGLSG